MGQLRAIRYRCPNATGYDAKPSNADDPEPIGRAIQFAHPHRNTDLPVYALVLARKDKTLGPQIKPSKVDCDAIAEEAQSRGGVPPPMPRGEEPLCSIGFSGRGRMSSRSKPISDLLTFFSQTTQRMVIDRTGLKGGWDIDLTWTPDAAVTPAFDDAAQTDSTGPSVFTAVQE